MGPVRRPHRGDRDPHRIQRLRGERGRRLLGRGGAGAGGRRAGDLDADREGLVCTSAEAVDASGLTLVVVRCTGTVPSLLSVLGNLLPLEVTGRAVKEAA